MLLISMFHSGLLFSQDTAQTSSVNTKQIEVSLVPDKATIMLGESTYLSFVVKNKSGHDLQVVVGGDYQNGLGRPDSFTVTVVGKDRKQVPQPKTGENMGGIMNAQKISALGNYVFKLFLPHWATFEEPGHYTIRASRILKLKLSDRSDIEWMENTTAMPVEATAEIEVVPLDKEKLGEIIDDLGKNMFASRNGFAARETMDRLKAIHDERVIPYFRLALKTDDYEMKFVALEALSKYNSDAALEGLKEGMATTGTDIGHTTNKEGANRLAAKIQ